MCVSQTAIAVLLGTPYAGPTTAMTQTPRYVVPQRRRTARKAMFALKGGTVVRPGTLYAGPTGAMIPTRGCVVLTPRAIAIRGMIALRAGAVRRGSSHAGRANAMIPTRRSAAQKEMRFGHVIRALRAAISPTAATTPRRKSAAMVVPAQTRTPAVVKSAVRTSPLAVATASAPQQ